MDKRLALLLMFIAPFGATSALAGVNGFAIVNQTGSTLSGLALRRVGDSAWVALGAAPAAGASAAISFVHPDCAFDIRASVAGGGQSVWRGVNLCEVKSVTLNRDSSGRTWVDYD